MRRPMTVHRESTQPISTQMINGGTPISNPLFVDREGDASGTTGLKDIEIFYQINPPDASQSLLPSET